MRSLPSSLAVASFTLLAAAACSSSSGSGSTTTSAATTSSTAGAGGATATHQGGGGAGGAAAGGGGAGGGAAPLCTKATPVDCSDQVVLAMNYQSEVTKGLITNDADGAGFRSHVDATAGGAFAPKPESYTYAKFTDKGLEKVAISDDKSLDSMDWDVAFRRYVVRVNSSASGPSCVQAARVPGKTYDEVTSLPDKLDYHGDDYFTPSPDCSLIPDGSGLPGSPATALSSYWTYGGCVKMSGFVFVVELADGKHVKLEVEDYYSPAVQQQCDTTNKVPQDGNGSGNFIVRWAYLP
jgi:hypothetical protein